MDKGSEKKTLIVFAREPVAGRIKTRLQKKLRALTVLSLYKAFVRDVLSQARKVQCANKIIFYTGSRSVPFLRKFAHSFCLSRQSSGDLGARMHQAFLSAAKRGSTQTIIMGTDCLSLEDADLNQAFDKLSNHDLVLGPCQDGGYYLIGLKKVHRQLFEGIPWGTSDVFPATMQKAKRLKLKVYCLKEKQDIDTFENLKQFVQSSYRHNAKETWRVVYRIKELKENFRHEE